MPNKSFSIYSSVESAIDEPNELIVEIAGSHLACIGRKENSRAIEAYELFTFEEDQYADFPTLFATIKSQSKILDRSYSATQIYFNNEFCIPIPIFKFNKDISQEYLTIVFGEDPFSKVQFEHLPIEPGIINAFRINENCFNFLSTHFSKATFHHTYSNIIRRVVQQSSAYPSQFISLQFYNTFLVVVVLKDGLFQLIQSFTYETPEDVLYYLLNITQQMEMFSEEQTIQISGLIDLDFQLYRELIKYFKNVSVENSEILGGLVDTNGHPVHYFTPFFNLAL